MYRELSPFLSFSIQVGSCRCGWIGPLLLPFLHLCIYIGAEEIPERKGNATWYSFAVYFNTAFEGWHITMYLINWGGPSWGPISGGISEQKPNVWLGGDRTRRQEAWSGCWLGGLPTAGDAETHLATATWELWVPLPWSSCESGVPYYQIALTRRVPPDYR